MAISDNIILNLPFDEPGGSVKTYDYSATRADGKVVGADFVSGKVSNAIRFNGYDYCKVGVTASQLNLKNDFTIFGWVKGMEIECGSPQQLVWLLNFNNGENYEEIPLSFTPGVWRNVALVRKGNIYTVYQNNKEVHRLVNSGVLAGISLSQDYYGGPDKDAYKKQYGAIYEEESGSNFGKGWLDDFKIYNIALSEEELSQALPSIKNLTYYIDGHDFKDFDVHVSESDGLLDRPKIKKPVTFNWDNYHGEVVDLQHLYYEAREITLSCFIKANGKSDFATKLVRFQQLFDKKGTLRLMVDIHPTKPLVYEVYCEESINVKKSWSEDLMVGTFTIKLREPDPVKRVLKHIVTNDSNKKCEISFKSNKLVNIYWGDGEVDPDVDADNSPISHTYKEKGEYYPVITGCIDEITDFSTNAIIVWSRL